MAERLAKQPGEGPSGAAAMTVVEVLKGPSPEGAVGEGLLIRTNRGDIRGILHRTPGANLGVVWVCGARGGFGGPGKGMFSRLAEAFRPQGIISLRLDYRQPNVFDECVVDLLAGVAFMMGIGCEPVVLVGHSFGGAVVIAAGVSSSHVRGVVSLSPQTYGSNMAGLLSPRPLLVVHGKSDTRLPYSCAVQIHGWAREPKRLVLYDGAEHRLEECKDELESLLWEWIPETLLTASNKTSHPT